MPAPLLLVAAGLAVSSVPAIPEFALDPHIVLPLLLPPLLHTAATDSSYLDLRAQLRPVALLSVGYVLFATVAVGWAAYLIVPGLPLTAALVLGAVVAPPDAVAATAIARRVGLPSRITTILQGESLVNDATAITAYRVALAAAVGEGATWAEGVGDFLLAAVGGIGIGLLLMVPIHWLRTRLKEALLQNTLSLLIPFAAYAVAEEVHASGVLAVVVVALYLGHRAWEVDFATRLQEEAVWKMVAFVLESSVFALIGLQLPVVLRGLGDYEGVDAAWYAVAVFVVVVVARFVWVYPATFLPRALSPRIRKREDNPTWKGALRPYFLGRDARRGLPGHRLLHPDDGARRGLPRPQPHPLPDLHHRHRHPRRPGPHPAAAHPPAAPARPRPAGRDPGRGQRPGAGLPRRRAAPRRTPRRRAQRPPTAARRPAAHRPGTPPQRGVGTPRPAQPDHRGDRRRHLPPARAGDDRRRARGVRQAARPALHRRRDAADPAAPGWTWRRRRRTGRPRDERRPVRRPGRRGIIGPATRNCAAAAIVEHLGSADTRGTSGTWRLGGAR
ncbi:hypothetical protein SGLAM104S_00122 [Streptomyces glaucescens]